MSTKVWGGREIRLFEAYNAWVDSDEAMSLRESGASTDFPNYMKDLLHKRAMKSYREARATWRQWTSTYELPDFKPQSFFGLTELPDLLEVVEGDSYKDQAVAERVGATITLKTYGRIFTITRKALINDDIGQLRDHPTRQGRAAARTLSRSVVGTLTGNGNAYDGNPTFDASTHKNLITDALSESGLAKAATTLATQTDDNGNPIELSPEVLVVPPALELTARRILNSAEIHIQGSGTTAAYGQGNENVMQGYVRYVVERYFTDATDWYLFASPEDAPVIGVGFLQGVTEPSIMLKDPGMRSVGSSASDPYNMEFDEMAWKCRLDWGTALLDWRGAVFAQVAG